MHTKNILTLGFPIALVLTACGGGGSSMVGGIEGGGAAVSGIEGGGVLSQLSQDNTVLSVGGKQLDVSDSALMVTVDSQPASLQTLRVGDRIFYSGTTSDDGVTIVVTSITQDDLVEGPLDIGSLNVTAGTFSVLGQMVRVSPLTVFASAIQPNDINGLMDGDFLEISGEINADGVIEATRIERETNDNDFEVTGVISSVDIPNFRFVLNGLTVDYSGAQLEGFGSNDPQVGDRVEVEGNELDASGVLISDEVELESLGYSGDEGDLAELEGIVTSVISAEQFELSGQLFSVSSQTTFQGGIASDIVVGSRLEVSGALEASGILLADEVKFEDEEAESPIGLQGVVDEVDSAGSSVVILGVTIRISSATRLEGDDDMPLSFDEIVVGSVLEVRGLAAADAPAILEATRVELEGQDDKISLVGPVEMLAEPELTVFGVTIFTDSETEFEGEGVSSAADFFQPISLGNTVEIEGTFDGSIVTASKVERDSD